MRPSKRVTQNGDDHDGKKMSEAPRSGMMAPIVWCPHCGGGLPYDTRITLAYFYGKELACPRCGKKIDWWKTLLGMLNENGFVQQSLVPIGAEATWFEVLLLPGERQWIDFTEAGVPSDAKILDINYTPNGPGGLFPVEFHGNQPMRPWYPNKRLLVPVPFAKDVELAPTKLSVFVTWVRHAADDESWQSLVDAFEHYTKDDLQRAIIPANVAVESKLLKFMTAEFESVGSRKSVEEFLATGGTYSHQLNLLLPMVVDRYRLPRLPDPIRGLLNRLKGLRHQLAHRGRLVAPLDKAATAELLLAAAFGFQYLRLVEMATTAPKRD